MEREVRTPANCSVSFSHPHVAAVLLPGKLTFWLSITLLQKGEPSEETHFKASIPFSPTLGKEPKIIPHAWVTGNQTHAWHAAEKGIQHSGSAPSTMTKILQEFSRLNVSSFLHPMDAASPSLALSGKSQDNRSCVQYLWQGVLGQLYLGKGFSSIGHVVAGSSTYCYLDHGGNKKRSDGATSWKILSYP